MLDSKYKKYNKHDAAEAGFDDSFIYKELSLSNEGREKVMKILLPEEAIATFKQWAKATDKIEY